MTQTIHLHRSKPLTTLLADLLQTEVPPQIRAKLAGLRSDGKRGKGRRSCREIGATLVSRNAADLSRIAKVFPVDFVPLTHLSTVAERYP